MRENPVELLTVVNPDESSSELERERWKWIVGGGIVSSFAYASYRRSVSSATTPEEAQRASRNHFLFMLAGGAVLYLFFGDRLKELAPQRNRRVDSDDDEALGEYWDLEENKAYRYFVRLPREGVTYPKKGSDYYPVGYPLRTAQDFARIGSQTGGPREVRRDRRGGKRIRTYTKGKRTWPTTRAQARGLLPAEIPKKLRVN